MMRCIFFTMLLSLYLTSWGGAQGVFQIKEALVLSFDPPYEYIEVDVLDKKSGDFLSTIHLTSETVVVKRKNKAIDPSLIRPGVLIEIEGKIENYREIAQHIRLRTDLEKNRIKVDGVLEAWDGQTAIIDGQRVRLLAKTNIEGDGRANCGCKGMKWESFDDLALGCFVEVKGQLGLDGIVRAEKASYCLNNYVKNDRLLREAVQTEYSDTGLLAVAPPSDLDLPVVGSLHQGKITVGGLQLKLVEDLRVQAYVNMVGQKLIPHHLKQVPMDAEEKLHFRFFVVDNPVFNAFAFPDGTIFVNSGLMKVIDNEAQLAAVLGHEIAHVTHEHGRKRYQTHKKIAGGIGVAKLTLSGLIKLGVIDQDDMAELLWDANSFSRGLGITQSLAGAILGSLSLNTGNLSNAFFKKHENQSDRVGLYYMQAAGYDPREAAKIWQKLMTLTADESTMEKVGNELETLLVNDSSFVGPNPFQSLTNQAMGQVVGVFLSGVYSSHPKAKKRFRNLNQLVAIYYHDIEFEQFRLGQEKYLEITGGL